MRSPSTAILVVALLGGMVGCREDAGSPSEPTPPGPRAAVTALAAVAYRQVSAGGFHTCGVTADGRTFCWGNNSAGQLGGGTSGGSRLIPTPIAGSLVFRQISAGTVHTCGVATNDRAYCWGANESGQLGDGTTTDRVMPRVVAGTRLFRQVEAGARHTCGVTTDNLAFCWGDNEYGQLGDGTTTRRLVPRAVAGGHQFKQVAAGSDFWSHTCGVTTDDRAFCWGSNSYGQLGDSTEVELRLKPRRVAGRLRVRQVDAGGVHSCAVTTDGRAFCWGNGRGGAIGNGKQYLSFWPRAVAGGLSFIRVSLGRGHSCGVTTSDRGYCWGSNAYGELGDGTAPYSKLRPVAVAGGLSFSRLAAGDAHTCGKDPAGKAYCWGANPDGRVGDGTSSQIANRLTPVPVADPE
jgi:alpha-tubulin suppressor-like RCC1 family protein